MYQNGAAVIAVNCNKLKYIRFQKKHVQPISSDIKKI